MPDPADPIPCPHWSECGRGPGGGCCAVEKHGPRPSRGTCRTCLGLPPPAPELVPLTLGRIAHGVAGIAKALAGKGGMTVEGIECRLSVCATCEHLESVAGMVDRCGLCRCITWAKVRNAAEKCPAGKW